MITDYAEMIKEATEDVAALEKLLSTCCPAAGITVSVKHGAMSEDEGRFPWTTFEMAEGQETILRLMLEARKKSLDSWKRSAKRYAEELASLTK